MKRIALTAGLTATALVIGMNAAAATTVDDSSAMATQVVAGSAGAPSTSISTPIGVLLAPVQATLNTVTSTVFTPLTTALTGLSGRVFTDLSSFAGTDSTATSSDIGTPPPDSGYPTCNTTGWDVGNCYGPSGKSLTDGSVLGLANGSLQGYAAADADSSAAKARTTNYTLSMLGVTVGDLGTAESSSTCDTTPTCSVTSTLTGMSLLGGAVQVRTASDGSLEVSVGNAAWVSASSLSSPVAVTAAGVVAANVRFKSGLVKLHVSLTLDNLLTALGIPTLESAGASDQGSTVTLSIGIGASSSQAATAGWAHGLDLSLGLSVNASLSVAGLVGLTLSYPNTSDGNLGGIQFAITRATASDSSSITKFKPEVK